MSIPNRDANLVTKETIEKMAHSMRKEPTDLLLEFLEYFDVEVAKSNNGSFRYFFEFVQSLLDTVE